MARPANVQYTAYPLSGGCQKVIKADFILHTIVKQRIVDNDLLDQGPCEQTDRNQRIGVQVIQGDHIPVNVSFFIDRLLGVQKVASISGNVDKVGRVESFDNVIFRIDCGDDNDLGIVQLDIGCSV